MFEGEILRPNFFSHEVFAKIRETEKQKREKDMCHTVCVFIFERRKKDKGKDKAE